MPKKMSGGGKLLHSPQYSEGTADTPKNTVGTVEGPKGSKACGDPLGYKHGKKGA